jgi:hypothetical protein
VNDFPQSTLGLVKEQLALMGRIGATRLYTTPPVASPAAAGGVSQPTTIRFNEPGYVLSMYGAELAIATAASQAQTGMRLQINGDEDYAVNGNGGAGFPSLLCLFGSVTNWMPMMRRVVQGDLYVFTFENNTAAGIIAPQVVLACLMDADVARMKEINDQIHQGS